MIKLKQDDESLIDVYQTWRDYENLAARTDDWESAQTYQGIADYWRDLYESGTLFQPKF